MSHLDKHDILTDVQHGFRKSHSCETQLITTIEETARNLDQGSQTDAILLDFPKAFDTVPHHVKIRSLRPTGRDKGLDSGMALR